MHLRAAPADRPRHRAIPRSVEAVGHASCRHHLAVSDHSKNQLLQRARALAPAIRTLQRRLGPGNDCGEKNVPPAPPLPYSNLTTFSGAKWNAEQGIITNLGREIVAACDAYYGRF